MPILTFVLRRLLHALPLLICVIVFNFFLIHLAPGNPIQAFVGEFPAPAAYLAECANCSVSTSRFIFNCCSTSKISSPAI